MPPQRSQRLWPSNSEFWVWPSCNEISPDPWIFSQYYCRCWETKALSDLALRKIHFWTYRWRPSLTLNGEPQPILAWKDQAFRGSSFYTQLWHPHQSPINLLIVESLRLLLWVYSISLSLPLSQHLFLCVAGVKCIYLAARFCSFLLCLPIITEHQYEWKQILVLAVVCSVLVETNFVSIDTI